MATIPVTSYAIGKNATLTLKEVNMYRPGRNVTPTAGSLMSVCIQTGSIDITAALVEILNNCQSGWATSVGGIKRGTITFTGNVSSPTPANAAASGRQINAIFVVGTLVYFQITCSDSTGTFEAQGGNDANLLPVNFSGVAVVTESRTAIDINEAVTCEMTLNLSGAPDDEFTAKNHVFLASSL